MGHSIKIIVKQDGGTEYDYNGFQGETCKASHAQLLKKLKKLGVNVNAEATVSTPKIAEAQQNEKLTESF